MVGAKFEKSMFASLALLHFIKIPCDLFGKLNGGMANIYKAFGSVCV